MRKVRENIIVAKGNQPLFPAGQEVFSCPNAYGSGTTINVAPGQLVIYDAATNISIAPGSTVADYDRIVIAVGCDTNGDGSSDVLRKGFGDSMFGCNINAATSETPKCGIPAISDILFKCTYCDEVYTIEIQVFDEQTDNEYPYNTPATYTYTVKTDCCDCEDCTPDHNCDELACKFVDAINGVRKNKSVKTSFFTPKPQKDFKFRAARLRQFSHDFCLVSESTECDQCVHYTGVSGAAGTGLNADYTTFSNTIDPANPTLSLHGQLAPIIDQINLALDGLGEAIPVQPVGSCCDLRIQVNTCIEDFELVGPAGNIAPCLTTLPLEPIENQVYCRSCDDPAPTTSTYCGIRLIQKLPQPECDCFPDLPGIRWFSGDINVYAKDGFSCGAVKTRKVQEATRPSNMGYQWIKREYWSDNGGHGRGHEPYNDQYGTLRLPGKGERAYSTKAECKKFYCSFIFSHSIPNTNNGVSSPRRDARGRTIVIIPIEDINTITEFEGTINPYITSHGCPIVKEVTCSVSYDTGLVDDNGDPILTTDQDQVESYSPTGEYPNQNGRIY